MKTFKSVFSLVLALMMCLGCAAFAEGAPSYLQTGDAMPDFTVTTWDGKTLTLSEVLKEKKMVLINIWATWCGPCQNEFPFMEEAYQLYKDQVEVIALTCEPTDTTEMLAQFTAAMGMTFPVASDVAENGGPNIANQILVDGEPLSGIPTSIVVDRFGNICFVESGSLPSTGAFTRLFDAFLGDDYTESIMLAAVPPMKPNVAPSAEADVSAALNVEGGTLLFTNPTDDTTWPMIVAQDGERTVVTNSNAGQDETTAAVNFTVTVNAGDVLAYDFKVSSEAACDMVTLTVDGKVKKVFGGEKDWMTYGYEFAKEGTYNVSLGYAKDMMAAGGTDTCMIDNVRVVSGDEAAAVLAANPAYPAGGMMSSISVVNGKQMFYVESQLGVLASNFGMMNYFVVDGTEAVMNLTLRNGMDPEGASIYNGFDGSYPALTDYMTADGYVYTATIDSTATTGYFYTPMYLYEDGTGMNVVGVMLFSSEEEANAFMDYCNQYGLGLKSWKYMDGTLPATDALPAPGVATEVVYTFECVDQDGNPVPGCIINVCTDETCQPMIADENGVVAFPSVPYEYHIQVISVPEGYDFDKAQEFYTSLEGGVMTFVMTKN